jgi:predicted ferric reductase
MKRTAWWVLAGAQLLIVVGCWLWFHTHHTTGNLLTGDAVGQLLAWGRLAGLLAVFAILFQFMLIGRVRWVERSYGMDCLTRLHHVVGFALIFLLLLHPVLITLGHARQDDVGYWAQAADFCKTWKGVLTAVIGLSLMMVASVFSILVLLKRVRYEFWYATHLVLYVAFGLSVLHQVVSGSDFTDHPAFKTYWLALYVFVFLNLLGYRFVRPLWAFARHRFVVTRVAPEAGDVTSVYMGGKNLEAFRVEAGQFMIVRFLAKGFRWEAHPFSMSCFPDGKQIRLSIKRLGDFTRRIPELKPGTPVLIDGPHGVFTSRACASDKVLLIAGGIGITPLRSLAEEMVEAGRDVVMLYGSRNSATLAFKGELDELAARAGEKLRLVYVMSDEPAWTGEKGRVDRERIARLVPDLANRDSYLCGPPVMMKGVRTALASLGVPSARIHDERFAL